MIGSINNRKLIIYIVISIVIISGVNLLMKFDTAKEFDKYNRIMSMSSVILLALVNRHESVKEMTLKLLFVGVSAYLVSLIAFNVYEGLNIYFSFEMNGFTWNGIAGFLISLIYWILAYLCSLVIYFAKLKIFKN